ncbi:regulator of nucleoside diphosphate kinase [Panacagrimonas perspica]|uniref:Regulator of nucleoside diphosphate kinase n=2 Tax=Panacagrimonas perspica TaxID=381431 RepID=A0A4S3K4Q7_9GAMM|nr:regulator of nucleoside diphosphate kinase [Panacagrimonas perspica]THD03059.1 hypothetical protein B1810_10710 [Panacagrimonas perspica]
MEQSSACCDPPLLIGDGSEVVLRDIARAAMSRLPDVAERLLGEVERAEIVAESDVPADVVRIGSFVTYQVQFTGAINTIRLVPPNEADERKLRVSVLSKIGTALIGLRQGQQIKWELGDRQHVVDVLRVCAAL